MKTWAIFVFIIALAVAAVPPTEDSYSPNKEYIYEYEAEALTGIPAASKHVAGIKVKATAHLQVKGANKVFLQLRGVSVCALNEELKYNPVTPKLSEPCAAEVTGPEAEVLKQELQKPIRFRWENGLVSLMQVDADDAYWSLNMKRGLLQMFHVNLQGLEALADMPAPLIEAIKAEYPSSAHPTFGKAFRAMEQDVTGECESLYVIGKIPGQTPVMAVTKVRNYDSCVKRPVFQTGIMAAVDCRTCSKKLPLRSQNYVHYHMKGEPSKFIILAANQTGHFVFKPLATTDGQAIAITRQTLTLADVAGTQSPITFGKTRVQKEPFIFEIPAPFNEIAAAMPVTGADSAPWVALIKQYVEKIVEILEAKTFSLVAPEMIADVVVQLRQIPLPALTQLVEEYVTESPEEAAMKKREIILDILPVLGRPDVLPVLKKLITEKAIAPARAAIMINIMALTAEPTPLLITDFLEFVKEPWAAENPLLKTSIMLTAGALTHTLNKIFQTTYVPAEIAIPARHKIMEGFKAALTAATKPAEKILCLKAIGNAGLVEFIPLLEPLIADTNEDPYVRSKAIYALRRVTPFAIHKVHALLLPVALNPAQPLIVRIAAMIVTFNTRPEAGVFSTFAQQIPREPSVQMASFMYTYMKVIASSELSCNRNVSEAARAAIKGLPFYYTGIPYSKLFNFETIISHFHHIGADISLEMTTPGVTVLPEYIVSRFDAYFAKSIFNVFEMGFESKGIQTLMRNLIGPENQWLEVMKGKKSLADMLSPLLDPSILNMDKIVSFLTSLKDREMPSLDTHMYFKLFDTELSHISLDTAAWKEIIRDVEGSLPTVFAKLNAGVPLQFTKALALVDQAVTLPTPAGLPVSIKMSVIALLNAKGSVKLEGATSLYQLVSGAPNINLKVDLHPKFLTETSGTMAFELGFLKAMTALRARVNTGVPIKAEIIADIPSAKMQFTFQGPQEPITLFKHDITPLVVIAKEIEQPTKTFYEKIVKPIYNPDTVLPIDVNTVAQAWGWEFTVKGKYAKSITPITPLRPLCMPHELAIELRPASGAPKFVELVAAYVIPETAEGDAIRLSVLKGDSAPISNSWFSMHSAPEPVVTFEPVQPDPSISSPIKRQIVFMLQTKETSNPIYAACQITVITGPPKYLKNQFNVQLAYKAASATPYIAHINTVLTVPAILISTAPVPSEKEELAQITLAYGPQGNTEEYVKVKSFFKILPESEYEYVKKTIADAVKPWTVDSSYTPPAETPFSYSRANRYMSSKDTVPGWTAAKPFQLIKEIEYKPIAVPAYIAPYLWRYMAKIIELPEYYFPTAEVSLVPEAYEPNKAMVVFTALPFSGMAKVTVKAPTMTVIAMGIPLPISLLWQPYHEYPILPEAFLRIAGHSAISGTCSLIEEKVKTFDAVEYPLPDTACETILAQDCSSKKLFRVTVEKSPEANTKKIVRLYLGAKTIEVIPEGSTVQVKFDGTPVTLAEGVPVEIKDSGNKVICVAIKKGAFVEVIEKKLNIKMETNCAKVSLKMPAWFRGVVCGMCGNFDSEKVADVKGPNMEEYAHPEHAIIHYVVPSPTCDVEELKKRFISTVISSGACAPAPKTVYIEHTLEGHPHACFSAEPVLMCPSACKPAGQIPRLMSFNCLPADLPSTKELLNRLNAGPLPPLTGKPAKITDTVITSTQCLPHSNF